MFAWGSTAVFSHVVKRIAVLLPLKRLFIGRWETPGRWGIPPVHVISRMFTPQVTPPKVVSSPTWGLPPPYKQALNNTSGSRTAKGFKLSLFVSCFQKPISSTL